MMKKLFLLLFLALAVPREAFPTVTACAATCRDAYTGNGSTTAYTYTFRVLNKTHLKVYVNSVLQTVDTHYTVGSVGSASGTITFVTAPPSGHAIIFIRAIPIEQTSDYIQGQPPPMETIEQDYDKRAMVDQMFQEQIARTLRYPETRTPTTALTELPAPVAEKCIGYNGDATALALNNCGGSGGGAAFTTSAGLAGILTDEIGTDKVVFSDSPTFTTKITLGTCVALTGSGSPEGVVTAPVCSSYFRTNGGASTTFYIKESGSGNTGWVAYGTPAGSGAPTTATYITQTADGSLSNEQALSSLSTGIVKVTTGTGVLSTALLGTDYLSPASSITNGQLPGTLSSKTLDNTNTITVQDTNLTIQDNADNTKQARFNASGITTATTRTLDLPNANTRLMADSDFSGSATGALERTGAATYTVIKNNSTAGAPGASSDSTAGYAVGSMWLNTSNSTWYRAVSVGAAAAVWQNLGATTEADGLSSVMGRDNSAVAESFATGLQITNSGGTVAVSRFVDPVFGPRDQCSPECDATTFIPTGKVWNVYSQSLGRNMFVWNPGGSTPNAKYQFHASDKPTVSLSVPLTERGAVTIALASIVANQPKDYYATVTDADTDALDFVFPITKRMEGMTTATVRLVGVSDHAAPAGNIGFHCAMKAYRPGTDTFAAHDTTGEVAVTLTPATTNRPVAVTSSAITINGTVAEGGLMYGSCEVSAANTTSAQLTDFFLSARAVITLAVNSLSD